MLIHVFIGKRSKITVNIYPHVSMYMYNQLYTIGYVCLLFAKSTANTKGAVYTQVLLSLVT